MGEARVAGPGCRHRQPEVLALTAGSGAVRLSDASVEILGRRLSYRPLEARTSDGLRIAAQDWGDDAAAAGERRDVVLIHGISQAYACWFKQLSGPLRERYRLVTYDLRGHGDSDKPLAAEYYQDGERWANEVQAVMDAAGLQRPVIVAWSYGGRVALDYVQHAGGGALAGLVMVAGTSSGQRALFGSAAVSLERIANASDPAQNIAATAEFLRNCVARPLPEAEQELMLAYNLKVPPAVRAAMGGRPARYESVLGSLEVPVLAIHGAADAIVLPAMALYTAKCCPNGRASIYEGVGHTPFWEAPGRFGADLAAYLDALPGPDCGTLSAQRER